LGANPHQKRGLGLSKLIEINHVSLGGEGGKNDWPLPYLDDDHMRYATQTLSDAEALILGRVTG
jgi:hypothetical protein